jgi:hypothetical protein
MLTAWLVFFASLSVVSLALQWAGVATDKPV